MPFCVPSARGYVKENQWFVGFLRPLEGNGGQDRIRTYVRLRGQIYSLLPLTTRPPVHPGIQGRPGATRAAQ